MAKKNRKTLKNYFGKGRMPSESHFGDLIDSTLNVIDEGFDKSAKDGFKIAQLGDSGKLLSFFENITVKSALWSIRIDTGTGNLNFDAENKKNILTLSPEGNVGINKKNPEFELDVEGVVASKGRIGSKQGSIPADGKWHDIIDELDGCQAFEVMSGVGGEKKAGKYALLHAFALNTFNAKGKIICHQSHYGSRCNRLQLRWSGKMNSYSLQLRTGYCFDDGVLAKYYITKLWFDPFMDESREKEDSQPE